MPVILHDYSRNWQRVRSSNSTAGSFASRLPTTTAPLEEPGVLNWQPDTPRYLQLLIYGEGADNSTLDFRVLGWKILEGTTLWLPVLLFSGTATLSTVTGVAGTPIDNNQRFADTLSVTYGTNNQELFVRSPADNSSPAHLWLYLRSFHVVEVQFAVSSATSANAVYTLL